MTTFEKNVEVDEVLVSPDASTYIPVYVPTIEETVKASGGHRQFTQM
ncbi:hypothetical protein WBN73_06510 [Paenarthrobacter sp. CCNWLY172]|nr:hypothetical protein [Arthrobacter sp. D5-1]